MKTKQQKRGNSKFTGIDEYIREQPVKVQPVLQELRQIIHHAAPHAEETISYNMPAFKLKGILVWFAGFGKHYSLYPFSNSINFFKEKLTDCIISKGTIRFSYDKPIPRKLISAIIKYRVNENLKKDTGSVKASRQRRIQQ